MKKKRKDISKIIIVIVSLIGIVLVIFQNFKIETITETIQRGIQQ